MAKKITPKKKTQKKKKEDEREEEGPEEELEEDEEADDVAIPTKGGKGALKAPVIHDDEDEVDDFWDSKPVPKDSDEDDIWGDDEDDDEMAGFSEEE